VLWLILIASLFIFYRPLSQRIGKEGGFLTSDQAFSSAWPIIPALVVMAVVTFLVLRPGQLTVDTGTLSEKKFSDDGAHCVVYTLKANGVIADGYRIDVSESEETEFYLRFAAIDDPFLVYRRLDVPSKGPIAATGFELTQFPVTDEKVTVTSVTSWEFGYLLKTEQYGDTIFRVWNCQSPGLEKGDLERKDLFLRLHANWDPAKPYAEVRAVIKPESIRRSRPITDGVFVYG